MRLIDADVLKTTMDECIYSDRDRFSTGYAKSFIDDAPTVDAVPVPVRCKNCKFNYGLSAGHGFCSEDIVCSYWDSDGLDENDYCSHGEQFAKECD